MRGVSERRRLRGSGSGSGSGGALFCCLALPCVGVYTGCTYDGLSRLLARRTKSIPSAGVNGRGLYFYVALTPCFLGGIFSGCGFVLVLWSLMVCQKSEWAKYDTLAVE